MNRPDSGTFDRLVDRLAELLPPGWGASLQLEDPLTHTLEEVASTDEDSALGSELLALAPMPEAIAEDPEPWILERLGFARCHSIPLAGERPMGRVLLYADPGARRLDDHRRRSVESLCHELEPSLDRQRAHMENEKFSRRLRRITEGELARRFGEALVRMVPELRVVAVFALHGEELTLLELRRTDGGRREGYLYRTLSFAGSHLEALSRGEARSIMEADDYRPHPEGELLSRFLERWPPPVVETLALEPSGRLAGSLVLCHVDDPGAEETRAAVDHLARALTLSLDRLRPERRQASSLLYLQELLGTSRGGGGLEPVLKTVVEEIVLLLGADAGVLALVEPETGSLLLSEHTGYESEAVVPDSIPLDPPEEDEETDDGDDDGPRTSISAHVVRSGEPYVASNTGSSPIYFAADETIRSEIAVPLRLHGETVGVALASSRTPGYFHPEDAARFQLFADQVAVAVDNARLFDRLRREKDRKSLRRQRRSFGFDEAVHAEDVEYHFGNLVGDPKGAMGDVYRKIERVAARDRDPVLIQGETGTGKQMVAHALHNASPRRDLPLLATDFAALGSDVRRIESELFGHERGAFPGARRRRRGGLEKADGSTLLVDELTEIVPAVQVKLLRVLGRDGRERLEFERMGGEETVRTDVRLLAATNKDLRREVEEGRFREDLFYRLSALAIRIPPLRERPEDLPLLLRHFIPRLGRSDADAAVRVHPSIRIHKGVVEELQSHPWPGNVRQLESVFLRALVMFGSPDELRRDDVRQALALEDEAPGEETERLHCPDPPPDGWFWEDVHERWKNHELAPESVRDLLRRELEATEGFYTKVAERLGVERSDYQRFMDFLTNAGLKVDYRPYRTGR